MIERKCATLEVKEGIGKITLNRPEKRNALSGELIDDLMVLFEEARKDDNVKIVTTTGGGDVAYCAGMDAEYLKYLFEHPDAHSDMLNLDEVIRNFPKVTIAVVNGYCLGAAITFLISHDLVIASEEKAKFGLPEIFRGFTPRYVVGALFRAVPMKYGMEMLLTGRNWDARKAEMAGLVSRVVPHTQLQETAFEWAKDIAQWDPITLEYCKKAAHATVDQLTYLQAIEVSSFIHLEHNMMNPKSHEGLKKFIEGIGVKADK